MRPTHYLKRAKKKKVKKDSEVNMPRKQTIEEQKKKGGEVYVSSVEGLFTRKCAYFLGRLQFVIRVVDWLFFCLFVCFLSSLEMATPLKQKENLKTENKTVL